MISSRVRLSLQLDRARSTAEVEVDVFESDIDPLVKVYMAIEHFHLWLIYLVKIVIFSIVIEGI